MLFISSLTRLSPLIACMDDSVSKIKNRKYWFAGGLVLIWVVSTVTAFWWFQFRTIREFDSSAVSNKTVFFESGELGDRLEKLVQQRAHDSKQHPGFIKVVHFWDPDCPCSRFNEVHVKQIMSEYAGKNVQFTIVVSGNDAATRKQRLARAQKIFNSKAVTEIRDDWPMQNGPPSSPAVGIISAKGELVYFGPYSLGARCSATKGQFVEKVLNKLQDKNSVKKQLNTLAVGCFCPWRRTG